MNANRTDRRTFLAGLSAGALAALTLPGCGGGGGKSVRGTGTVIVSVTWPTQTTRYIPKLADRIRVTIKDGATTTKTGLIERPANSVSLKNVPVGSALTMTGEAYLSTDANQTVMASGTSASFALEKGGTATPAATMGTTISALSLSPSDATIDPPASQTFTASATDASGATVLMSPAELTWATSVAAVGVLTPSTPACTATLAARALGTTTITVTNVGDSAKSVSATASATVVDYRVAYTYNTTDIMTATLSGPIDVPVVELEPADVLNRVFISGSGAYVTWLNRQYHVCRSSIMAPRTENGPDSSCLPSITADGAKIAYSDGSSAGLWQNNTAALLDGVVTQNGAWISPNGLTLVGEITSGVQYPLYYAYSLKDDGTWTGQSAAIHFPPYVNDIAVGNSHVVGLSSSRKQGSLCTLSGSVQGDFIVGASATWVSISADGSVVAWRETPRTICTWSSSTDTVSTLVTAQSDLTYPQLSPDGRKLVFVMGGGIYVVDASRTNVDAKSLTSLCAGDQASISGPLTS